MTSLGKYNQYFYKIERWLFYLIIITMPVTALPKRYPIPNIMRNVPQFLLMVALTLAIFYFFKNYRLKGKISKQYRGYFSICFVWPILCTTIGFLTFPYWNAGTDDYLRNTYLIQKIAYIYPDILNNAFLLHLKYGIFLIRETIFRFLMPLLGIPFIFWIAFKDKGNAYILHTLSQMALLVSGALAAYSLIETVWLLTDNQFLAGVLKSLYTCIWDPGTDKDHWWPMLLWKGRLRSFYGEPGHFGVMAMFILPFLWYRVFELKKKGTALLLLFFAFMIFMTHSRTALAVFCGEVLILLIISILAKYPEWKQYIVQVLLASLLSFGLYVFAPVGVSLFSNVYYSFASGTSSTQVEKKQDNVNEKSQSKLKQPQSNQVEQTKKDISSITSTKERSNGSRLGNLVAKLNVARQHPLFGVGTSLESRYMVDNIPDFAKSNSEIKSWTRMTLQEFGKGSGFASINEYAVVLVEYGVIGLLLYLIPLVYLFIIVFKYKSLLLKKFSTVCIVVAVCGQAACQLGTGLWLTYPTSLAIAYCIIFNDLNTIKNKGLKRE